MPDFMTYALLRKESMSSFQLLLAQLVSLLDNLLSFWDVMLLEVPELKRRYASFSNYFFPCFVRDYPLFSCIIGRHLHFCCYWLKVDLLKNKFGFDEAFNYKEEEDLSAALKRYVQL